MFTAGDLKYTADEYRRKAQEQNEIAFNNALKTNIDYLEKTAKECAEKGMFACMSYNLADKRWRKNSSISQEAMEKRLWNGLYDYFAPLGFQCEGQDSNYLTLRWGDEDEG